MFFKYLINYLFGRVHIVVEGFFIEKFINICINKKILLSNIKVENGCILNTQVSVNDYKNLKSICRKTKCKMKIIKKTGLPFLLNKYRKRKLIMLFCIIILGLSIYANSLIWDIKVINSDDFELNNIVLNEINELNINKFSNKYSVDKYLVANELMIRLNELSWVEVSIKGVTLNIDIRKRIDKPDIIDKNVICNIVAIKPGVVDKVICRSGKVIAQNGSVVDEGDLLISGIIDSEYIDDIFVHSEGEVYARVWYGEKIYIPFYEEKVEYTGEEKKVYGSNLKNIKLFFGKLSTNYKEYDTILNEKTLSVGNIKTNIVFYEYIVRETNTELITRTVEQATQSGIEILEKTLDNKLQSDGVILDKREIVTNTTDGVNIELIYECLEQIGTKEKIN